MAHDFKKFPELSNSQMEIYYFESPHKQILESFDGKVTKVTDGDTIHVKWRDRVKPVVVRFIDTAAPERDESGGEESRRWLDSQIMNKDVEVIVDPKNRIGKWGRILGRIIQGGRDINRTSVEQGFAVDFESRKEGQIIDFDKELEGARI